MNRKTNKQTRVNNHVVVDGPPTAFESVRPSPRDGVGAEKSKGIRCTEWEKGEKHEGKKTKREEALSEAPTNKCVGYNAAVHLRAVYN